MWTGIRDSRRLGQNSSRPRVALDYYVSTIRD
jgi:hypothetical protein